ncbi:MAG: NlpC/P60 family protein [Blastococcus sp.]
MDSSTRSRFPRATARIAGTALAVAVVVGLTPAVAEATPRRPSDNQVAAARAAADAVTNRIGELSDQLTAAQDTVDAAHAASTIALDEYQATQAAVEVAQQESAVAQAAAAQATADLGVARGQVVAFARRSFMEGSTYPGATALLTAADPGQLIERAALLEAAGAHRTDVLGQVTVLQAQAAQADEVARTALVQVTVLQEQAATALAVAQTAEISAREQAAELTTQQAALETELTSAQAQLQELVGAQAAADRMAQVAPPAPAAPPVSVPAPPAGNPTPAGPADTSAAQVAIAAAMSQLGVPYAWGGGGSYGPGPGQAPDLGVIGFDCSGLTQYAYKQAGISIQRNSRAQYASLPKVDSDDLQPGDLVFWATDPGNPGTIHHVAIYLGNAQIVEAPESGTVVKVSAMRWRNYAGAVRPSAR